MQGKANSSSAILVARLAWLATFVVPLVLAGLLLVAKAAHATPATPVVRFAGEADEIGDEVEIGEVCEEGEEELEEEELGEDAEEACAADAGATSKVAGSGSIAPEECLVRSATARLVAHDSHNTVRLTVGYTTYEPTAAVVEYGLSGKDGSLHLGTAKRQLGRSGVLRLSKSLSDAQMAKVQSGGQLTVRLHSLEAPASCRPFETEKLTARHASRRLAVWSSRI
jgi:hypothetical protein